ncbi:phosphoadenylyl-sulfate reductase [Deltaproteobacteria bacterium PRO3]|nr:phosphoadenylyl-sulfate reductase [Deltaproteobacteria bacterium PRO3]
MAKEAINEALIQSLEPIQDPQALIGELFRRFGDRAAIGTSGQLTGVVMVDLAVKAGLKPRVFTIDTLRLFPETYELFDALERKYSLKVEKIQPDPEKLKAMLREHGEFLFFDSKEKQELCCHLRKVEPNERVLGTLDVWLTGLRADQSKARAATGRFEIIPHGPERRPILKVAPLVDWTEERLRRYCEDNGVPVHKLLFWEQDGWRYESLGCVICTTPIGPFEPRRAGRWRWFNGQDDDKECGLHVVKKDEV